jgi:hypothetical protein
MRFISAAPSLLVSALAAAHPAAAAEPAVPQPAPQEQQSVEQATAVVLVKQLTEALFKATHQIDVDREQAATREQEWHNYVAPLIGHK